jgi:plastocyanin
MTDKKRLNTVIGWVLGTAAVGFVLLLAGVASGLVTDDPPAVSPYASGPSSDGGDPFDNDGYDAGSDSTAPDTTVAVATAAITIQDFAFGDPITVATGQEVVVTNSDGLAHTWTSTDAVFDSSSIAGGGGSFTFTFDEAGEYDFFCAIHPSMTGSITVTG